MTPETAAPEPPLPRLHRPQLSDLFVLTFFVCLFLGLCRYGFESDYSFVLMPMKPYESLAYSLGVACCWTGMFRMRFLPGEPTGLPARQWQPGEMICVVEGAYYLVVAAIGAVLRMHLLQGAESVAQDAEMPFNYPATAAIYLLPAGIMSVGYLWMAKMVTVPAWRKAAVAKVVGHFGAPLLLLVLVSDIWMEQWNAISILLLLSVAVPAVMVIRVAWQDRQRAWVHWTHWLGVTAFVLIYVARLALEIRIYIDGLLM